MIPYFVMPIVANVVLGSEQAAYLYATWSLAGFVFFLPIALATALFASGARDTSTFVVEFRFTLRIAWAICAAANLLIFLVGGNPPPTLCRCTAPGRIPSPGGRSPTSPRGFHSYWVTRRPGSVTIGVDDRLLKSFTPETLLRDSQWVFDNPMFLLFNLAVGGAWSGRPDGSTSFPATVLVDWVRFEPLD